MSERRWKMKEEEQRATEMEETQKFNCLGTWKPGGT
jgi:hypothetical protein